MHTQAMHNFVMQLALRGKKNVLALGTFEVFCFYL